MLILFFLNKYYFNLKYATFNGSHQVNYDVVLNCGTLKIIEILKIFLNNNSQVIGNMNFQGIDNSILMKMLSKTCEKFKKLSILNISLL